MEGFLRYDFGGLIFGGASTWRGIFSEFCSVYRQTLLKMPAASSYTEGIHTGVAHYTCS